MKTLLKTFGVIAALTLSPAVAAAPLHMALSGIVTKAEGVWSGFTGTDVTAALVFDLDESNASETRWIERDDEPPFTRWNFAGGPYRVAFSGAFGDVSYVNPWIDTYKDFDTDAAGNPFGVSGLVDGLGVYGGDLTVDCSNGGDIPICSDAPPISGMELGVEIMAGVDWLIDDATLPDFIPAFGDLLGVFGWGELWADRELVGSIEIAYSSMQQLDAANEVPEPSVLALLGLGILALRFSGHRANRLGRLP